MVCMYCTRVKTWRTTGDILITSLQMMAACILVSLKLLYVKDVIHHLCLQVVESVVEIIIRINDLLVENFLTSSRSQ